MRAEDIGTEVFFLPAAAHTEKDGTFTNTQRLLQWHHKAVEPPGDCRSELWFAYHLFAPVRERLAGSTDPKDRPLLDLDLGLPDCTGPHDEPDAEAVLQEINGRKADGSFVAEVPGARRTTARRPAARGSTPGIYADGVNQTARTQAAHRAELDRARVGLGVAGEPPHPLQPRVGRPRRQRRGRSASATSGGTREQGKWTSLGDDPDFVPDKPPDYRPRRGRDGHGRDRAATTPFIAAPRRARAGSTRRRGLVDGPLPTHYEPHESPVDNRALRPAARTRRASVFDRPDNPYNPRGEPGATSSRSCMTTYRLTEHHTAGGMSRTRAPTCPSCSPSCSARSRPSWPRARARARRLGDDRHGARRRSRRA